MSEFNFITAKETYRALYYQLPKVLFTSPFYKDMSNDSKIAYAMLQDRCEASIENNWIDDQDRVYFIFTRNELMDILGCKENKISKIKKELKEKNLLYEQRTAPVKLPNGEWLNSPNRLYLGKLQVTAEDVFTTTKKEQTKPNPESGKNPLSNKPLSDKDSSGGGKNPLSTETPSNQHSPESGKKGGNLFNSISSLDTNRYLKDTEKDFLQDQLLLENFTEMMTENNMTFVPGRALDLIKVFSKDYTEATQTVKTIHNAKAKAQKETENHIVYEDLESIYKINVDQRIYMTLLRAYQLQKTEKVKNMQNVIFKYIQNLFIDISNEIQSIKKND